MYQDFDTIFDDPIPRRDRWDHTRINWDAHMENRLLQQEQEQQQQQQQQQHEQEQEQARNQGDGVIRASW